MKRFSREQGVEVLLECLEDVDTPHCSHGPTLLFERYYSGKKDPERFYACAACRDRKECNFYQLASSKTSQAAQEVRRSQSENQQVQLNHKKCVKRFKEILNSDITCVKYCCSCNILLLPSEWKQHKVHLIKDNLSLEQLKNPSKFLPPLDNNKTNAQFLFTDDTCDFMIKTIMQLRFNKVLCIGTPRLHEAISKSELGVSSLLLDIDHRFGQFFTEESFCRYNMFNHHFFDGAPSKQVFESFMERDQEKTIIVIDPPFGGLAEVLAFTLKRISSKKGNDMNKSDLLPTLLFFPYYLEPKITENIPCFRMSDYRVNYTNHDSYSAGPKGRKCGSPVRIFTNIPLNSVELPSIEYRLCEKCQKYVHNSNKHCEQCNACTSKDGKEYKHCEMCERCVKPSRIHCTVCNICVLPHHNCDTIHKPGCHICGDISHKRKECPNRHEIWKKRKAQKQKGAKYQDQPAKKRKLHGTHKKSRRKAKQVD